MGQNCDSRILQPVSSGVNNIYSSTVQKYSKRYLYFTWLFLYYAALYFYSTAFQNEICAFYSTTYIFTAIVTFQIKILHYKNI